MIYISAQSDDLYFLWQLEVQLENFGSLGIPPENIHVLIGFNPEKGLKREYQALIAAGRATFFTYADERVVKNYKSSIRPHILKKHFREQAYLEKETIFYHDCDIIFRERLNEQFFGEGDTWYLSKTPYISYKVLEKHGGRKIVDKLCSIVGIPRSAVEQHEPHTGGAQYVLKNLSYAFWEKVEKDCEAIYSQLVDFNLKRQKGLQAWCADMWAVLWNGLLYGHSLEVHPALDFCWPKDAKERWYETNILHNSGVLHHEADTIFCKGLYLSSTPYFSNFTYMDENLCSRQYVHVIERFAASIKREDLRDVTFVFPARIESSEDIATLDTVTRYIAKNFRTNIHILEIDDLSRINKDIFVKETQFFFSMNKRRGADYAPFVNQHVAQITTPLICICEPNCIVPPKQVLDAVKSIRESRADFCYPFDELPFMVRQDQAHRFQATLDHANLGTQKASMLREHYYTGWCFFDKNSYAQAGMENERLRTWGIYSFMERNKRMRILGYKELRIPGPFFYIEKYIPHIPEEFRISDLSRNLNEYVRICGMKKKELENDVAAWAGLNKTA
ncbi:hypothetical protein EGT74_13890 [Chitinophaga lutea]|uniref:Uncharacterized protein n=1 Tax=Chitinophaga lutea TaxID=2488634 RepID=A0A3N4PK04_9BACT|nr:hypothetical protein [Chitinophaga lutea]RPE08155.1 hypothetical protein EGT74_13890 [Chitinophaga lutea]